GPRRRPTQARVLHPADLGRRSRPADSRFPLRQLHRRRGRAPHLTACTRRGTRHTGVMSYVMVDIEADGPAPGLYSMISFGAVLVTPALDQTFYGQLRPISEAWIPEALAVSGWSRAECDAFDDPRDVMARFADWITGHAGRRPIFISDNNGF